MGHDGRVPIRPPSSPGRVGRAVVAGVAVLVGAALLVLVPSRPAAACSCSAPDPASAVELEIRSTRVADREPSGDGYAIVDLRGEATTLVGPAPAQLEGVDLDTVPVLSSVRTDPESMDSCDTPLRPAPGTDLAVTGHVGDDEGALVIFTGPCSGSFTITAAPPPADDPSGPQVAIVVGAGAAALVALALVPWWSRRRRAAGS